MIDEMMDVYQGPVFLLDDGRWMWKFDGGIHGFYLTDGEQRWDGGFGCGASELGMPTSLEELREGLRALRDVDTPWDRLPVFGGSTPDCTNRVWSWDDNRLLVGTCADDLVIVTRSVPQEPTGSGTDS